MITSTDLVEAALQAWGRGWTPVPIRRGGKAPAIRAWQHTVYDTAEDVTAAFVGSGSDIGGIGLVLGAPSSGLVDIDLDHPRARRLAPDVLPATPMISGRDTSRRSHWWYTAAEHLPPRTRQWRMPDGAVIVEIRSTGGQTVVPPSPHYSRPGVMSGDVYLWEGEPWGGEAGPAQLDGREIYARGTTLALVTLLSLVWPDRGGRHEAYLALAGALLRTPSGDVHPLWERALPGVIRVLAAAVADEDGPEARVREVVPSTMRRLRTDARVRGWPTLAGMIGHPEARAAREMVREIERVTGYSSEHPHSSPDGFSGGGEGETRAEGSTTVTGDLTGDEAGLEEVEEERQPLAWEPVDVARVLLGGVEPPRPTMLGRADGQHLLYPGRVNMLYGAAESGKSWVALHLTLEQIAEGRRVMYVDLEDDAIGTLGRALALGAAHDDLIHGLCYLRPDGPLTAMLAPRWGGEPAPNPLREANDDALDDALREFAPALVVVDGMTVLYGLHGLSTNDSGETDRIIGWLKRIAAGGRRTVLLIDHVRKGSGRGATPIGSQHKLAMVQGAALQVVPVEQPAPGRRAAVELIVGKDRPGAVRAIATDDDPQVAAEIVIDSTAPDGQVRMTVRPALPDDDPDMAVVDMADPARTPRADHREARNRRVDRVAAVLGEHPEGLSFRALFEFVGGRISSLQETVQRMAEAGRVTVEIERGRHVHRLVQQEAGE